tara:strand:+ start:761 stop:1255 length:495 start_codon:yes stop_codon:yes gene_type:complete
MKTFSQLVIVALSSLFFSSCGSDAPKEVVADTVVEETTKNWEEFTISAVGNTMQDMMYSEKNLNVKEGSWVRIILKNEGVDQAMIHNILFVNFGKRKDLALLANEAGPDNEFIPSSPDLIAASGLALPGETITLEFKAPEKGNYEFFCSYPGHAGMMKGYLFVK